MSLSLLSSDGIARAAAEKFAAEGANVAMCSRDAKKLNAAAAQIRERYGVRYWPSHWM